MAGAGPAGYSGVHSRRTLSTTQDRGPGGGQVTTAITGSQHGKKTCSTPPGCMTTHTLTNGNLRRGDFAGMSEVATAPYTFASAMDSCVQASSAVISPPATAGSACMNARAAV